MKEGKSLTVRVGEAENFSGAYLTAYPFSIPGRLVVPVTKRSDNGPYPSKFPCRRIETFLDRVQSNSSQSTIHNRATIIQKPLIVIQIHSFETTLPQ